MYIIYVLLLIWPKTYLGMSQVGNLHGEKYRQDSDSENGGETRVEHDLHGA